MSFPSKDKFEHEMLIGISCEVLDGLNHLARLVRSVGDLAELVKCSSVYESIEDETPTRNTVVLRMSTNLSASSVLDSIQVTEIQARLNESVRSAEVMLLAYDYEAIIGESLTLPHPSLVFSNATLQAASEAWGAYQHPVLQKSIVELVSEMTQQAHFNFVCTARSLIQRSGEN